MCECCGCRLVGLVMGKLCDFCTEHCGDVDIPYTGDMQRGFGRLVEVMIRDGYHTIRDAIEDNGGCVHECFDAVMELGIEAGERFASEVRAIDAAFRNACTGE